MGSRVGVGGYRLHVSDQAVGGGAGTPVVFVAGLGETGSTWTPVLDRLVRRGTLAGLPARLVTYDRAGLGGSDPRPDPLGPSGTGFSYGELADELRVLLHAGGTPAPRMLIGHSVGGSIVRAYAARWPDDVAGAVFLDASHPDFSVWPGADPEVRDGDGATATVLDLPRGAVELRAGRLPAVPAAVASRAPGTWARPSPELDELWAAAQSELATAAGALHVTAHSAGHRLHEQVPELAAILVAAVLRAATTGRPLDVDPTEIDAAGAGIVRPAPLLGR